ncbi:hypothetical protein AAFN60_16545 [Roseibacillus persicicus]|uniref:hypothetical protein n=1 Tax=Roseibacillus persicicus TaxID=454148 RepID=UPI00398B4CFE
MGSKSSQIIILILGLLTALFIVVSIFTGFGNVIGRFYRYLLPAAFLIGASLPRFSMFLLFVCAGYIDVLKKAMAFDPSLFFIDLYFILGIPPMLLVGIAASFLSAIVLGKIEVDRRLSKLIVIAIAVLTVTSALGFMKAGLSAGTLKVLANSALYYSLIVLVPAIFRTEEEVVKLLKFVVICFIPAALHGLWHATFGLFEFELIYLTSGMSMVAGAVSVGEGRVGPFASQGALAGAMGVVATFAAIPFFMGRGDGEKNYKFLSKKVSFVLVVVFLITGILSLKRMPNLILPLTICFFFILRSRLLTTLGYFFGVIAVVLVVTFSDRLAEKLPDWQNSINTTLGISGQSTTQQLTKIRTFNKRFEDFGRLKEPANWQPFGISKMELMEMRIHSGLVRPILRYGYIATTVAFLVAMIFLFQLHRRLVLPARSSSQRLFLLFSSMAAALVITSFAGANFFDTFPMPVFFGLGIAMITYYFVWEPTPEYRKSQEIAVRERFGNQPREDPEKVEVLSDLKEKFN